MWMGGLLWREVIVRVGGLEWRGDMASIWRGQMRVGWGNGKNWRNIVRGSVGGIRGKLKRRLMFVGSRGYIGKMVGEDVSVRLKK